VLSRANEDELRRRIVNGSREPDDFRQLAGLLTTAGQTGAALDVLEQALMLPLDTVARAEILAQLLASPIRLGTCLSVVVPSPT